MCHLPHVEHCRSIVFSLGIMVAENKEVKPCYKSGIFLNTSIQYLPTFEIFANAKKYPSLHFRWFFWSYLLWFWARWHQWLDGKFSPRRLSCPLYLLSDLWVLNYSNWLGSTATYSVAEGSHLCWTWQNPSTHGHCGQVLIVSVFGTWMYP